MATQTLLSALFTGVLVSAIGYFAVGLILSISTGVNRSYATRQNVSVQLSAVSCEPCSNSKLDDAPVVDFNPNADYSDLIEVKGSDTNRPYQHQLPLETLQALAQLTNVKAWNLMKRETLISKLA